MDEQNALKSNFPDIAKAMKLNPFIKIKGDYDPDEIIDYQIATIFGYPLIIRVWDSA